MTSKAPSPWEGEGAKEVLKAEKASSATNYYSTKRGDRNVSVTQKRGLYVNRTSSWEQPVEEVVKELGVDETTEDIPDYRKG